VYYEATMSLLTAAVFKFIPLFTWPQYLAYGCIETICIPSQI